MKDYRAQTPLCRPDCEECYAEGSVLNIQATIIIMEYARGVTETP